LRASYAEQMQESSLAKLASTHQEVERERQQFRAASERVQRDVATQNLANDQAHNHPGRPGKLGRLTHSQEAHLEARMQDLEQRYGARPAAPEEGSK
ncbi:MAG: hypothetical protein ACYDCB_11125, partial [Candidatus Dormibacteria bacterium]